MRINTNEENCWENATVTSTVVMTLHICITPVEGVECMLNKTSSNCNLELYLHVPSSTFFVEIEVSISE